MIASLFKSPLTKEMAEAKQIWLVVLLSLVLPGTAEMYLGGPFFRGGVLRLFTFVMGWILIVGIVGIFIVPLVWLTSIIDGLGYAFRMRRLRHATDSVE